MEIIELQCFQCENKFLAVKNKKGNFFYKKKTKTYSKVIKLTNVEQIPITKYFCNKRCKDTYIFKIRKSNWYKNIEEKEKFLIY